MTPKTAEEYGFKNQDIVWVKVNTPERSTVLGDVVVRVHENFADAMHIDTDESNAIGATPDLCGEY